MIVLLAIALVAIVLLLVTSNSSAALRVTDVLTFAPQQQITPTPTEEDASVPGSTDGIVWMGIVIALIVSVPVLASRAMWSRQT